MQKTSRVENSIKNMLIGLGGQVLSLLLSFINRTVFISTLGEAYLGINGLFSSILSILSLAELGVGSAIVYSMYKPLAEDDKDKLKKLMNLYRQIYHIIGVVVAIIGVILIPFLDLIIKDKPDISNIIIIYMLFLLNSVLSYFFAYKRSIIIADQKNYLVSMYQYSFNIIQIIIQVIILKVTNNFILYLIIQCLGSITLNIYISKKADKIYPFLKNKTTDKLESKEIRNIFKNVYALFMYKINAIILNSTDNIVISMFVGINHVGLYSNYLLLVNSVIMILSIIFNSLTASIGNLNASESTEKKYEVYNIINFISFWIYGFSSICLLILINPFIDIWIGKEYLLSNFTVICIVINFYTTGMQFATSTYRDSTGLFWDGRYLPIVASIINLVISIILVPKLGIAGVILGTIISRLSTYFWFDTCMLYKNVFNKPYKKYFLKYFLYSCVVIFTFVITNLIGIVFSGGILITFLWKLVVCIIVPNIIFLLLFYRTKEFEDIFEIINRIIGSKINYLKSN